MDTTEVAKKLIRYCRERRHRKAVEELYADDCVSREMPGVPDEILQGKEQIAEKNRKWFDSVATLHDVDVSDPIVVGDFFSCRMTLDVTFQGQKRMVLEELCVYEVNNGRIVSEQFFYNGPEA